MPGFRAEIAGVPYEPHPTMRGVERRTIMDKSQAKELSFHTVRLAPGAEIAVHTHEGQAESFYVISGDGACVMDGEETPFAAGCVGYAPEGVVHGIKNTGTGPLEVLCIFTPPRG